MAELAPAAPTRGEERLTTAFHRIEENGETVIGGADVIGAEVAQEFLGRFPGGMFRYPADGADVLDCVNTGMLELFGCRDYQQFRDLTGNTFRGVVFPDDWERVCAEIESQTACEEHDRVRFRIRRADGEIRWVDDCGRLVVDSSGKRWFYVTVIDITDRVRDLEQLRRANQRLEIIAALSNDVLFDIECASGEAHVYGDFEGRFGRAPEQPDFVVHRRCRNECSLRITSHDLAHLIEQAGENSLIDFETSTTGADGELVSYRYQSVVLYDEDGDPVRHVGRLLDTNEAALRESRFRRKAERDGLTGLLNRSAALDRIATILNGETRPCTLIIIDVDDFKHVNDTYGHPEGDRVLRELAAFLSQVMRKEDVVARLGGDEFVIFAPGLAPGPASDRVLEHLARGPFATQRATDSPTQAAGVAPGRATPSISIGAACCLAPSLSFEEMYALADRALYQSKETGKARYQLTVVD